jgi:hypothetical protein
MGRTTRIRRPPNREPTSLAGAALLAGASSENEAINTVELLARNRSFSSSFLVFRYFRP